MDLQAEFLLELSRGLHGLVETQTVLAFELHEVGIKGACWVVETIVLARLVAHNVVINIATIVEAREVEVLSTPARHTSNEVEYKVAGVAALLALEEALAVVLCAVLDDVLITLVSWTAGATIEGVVGVAEHLVELSACRCGIAIPQVSLAKESLGKCLAHTPLVGIAVDALLLIELAGADGLAEVLLNELIDLAAGNIGLRIFLTSKHVVEAGNVAPHRSQFEVEQSAEDLGLGTGTVAHCRLAFGHAVEDGVGTIDAGVVT